MPQRAQRTATANGLATEDTENGNGEDFVTATATAFATEDTENGNGEDFVTTTAKTYGLRLTARSQRTTKSKFLPCRSLYY